MQDGKAKGCFLAGTHCSASVPRVMRSAGWKGEGVFSCRDALQCVRTEGDAQCRVERRRGVFLQGRTAVRPYRENNEGVLCVRVLSFYLSGFLTGVSWRKLRLRLYPLNLGR